MANFGVSYRINYCLVFLSWFESIKYAIPTTGVNFREDRPAWHLLERSTRAPSTRSHSRIQRTAGMPPAPTRQYTTTMARSRTPTSRLRHPVAARLEYRHQDRHQQAPATHLLWTAIALPRPRTSKSSTPRQTTQRLRICHGQITTASNNASKMSSCPPIRQMVNRHIQRQTRPSQADDCGQRMYLPPA